MIDREPVQESDFVNLETHYEKRINSNRKSSPWVIVFGLINEGKYFYRNDNCLWVDALKDLPDSELKYYVCCYGDYQGAKDLNENIILTMEHTIAQGDPYCSRVLHDTRFDWDLRHPSKHFWDSISPLEKNNEKKN